MLSPSKSQELTLRLLADDDQRWQHVQAVAARASELGASLGGVDVDVLESAAWLHDIGYADDLAVTGFHHLDGARYLRGLGQTRLAGLVAFHGSGAEEAVARGLADELAEFSDERSITSAALTYCDLTAGPAGGRVEFDDRVEEIVSRYGAGHPVADGVKAALPRLRDQIAAVEAELAATTR